MDVHSYRTYARGGGMHRMDPEEAAERERRKKQAEETQRIIQQQVILVRLFQHTVLTYEDLGFTLQLLV